MQEETRFCCLLSAEEIDQLEEEDAIRSVWRVSILALWVKHLLQKHVKATIVGMMN